MKHGSARSLRLRRGFTARMDAVQELEREFTAIAVLAFGTLGDVLPVAAATARIPTIRKACQITFISHSAHEFLRRPLAQSGILFHPISTAPVSLPPGDTCVQDTGDVLDSGGNSSVGGTSVQERWRSSVDKQHREECLLAVDQIFGREEEEGLIIFNFFALEGWHLAELYRVPCAVAAPYVVPYSAPASFERQFCTAQPLLFRRLQIARHREVGWSEVIHWMWPLFTSRWTTWRAEGLHLSACPLTDPVTELPVSQDWPQAPPLLYGFSQDVVECPDYWPQSIRVCGFWYAPAEWEGLLSQDIRSRTGHDAGSHLSLEQKLLGFLSNVDNEDNAPLYIGLSSVGSMGYLKDPDTFLRVILTVLEVANLRAILHTASYAPLDSAVKRLLNSSISKARNMENDGEDEIQLGLDSGVLLGGDRLFCFSQPVSHNWLFPHLSVIIHHGGSGTTAAALRSGIPQVICPFLLDQFYWAERMAWIGVAPEPLKPNHLFPEGDDEFKKGVLTLKGSILDAFSVTMRKQAAAVACKIRHEDGSGIFAQTLLKEFMSR
ncbi:hypothetical protein R1flu_019539 [Riccia fluitans]|uniref:Erythromycin biosynthesis protein CIII-like C-terminal domain-containing protein n=1 Tax=Riccia fluitans TaxID=41844 RepID=A0ABD1ZL45_9MARC